MASNITKEQREFFENYLKEHPIKDGEPLTSDKYDGDETKRNHQVECAKMMKLLLEGKI